MIAGKEKNLCNVDEHLIPLNVIVFAFSVEDWGEKHKQEHIEGSLE